MNVGGAGDNNNNPSPNNNPPPLPPRPIQPPSNFAPHSQQLFVSQQPPPFIPYNNANGVYNYNCYQQGPSFTNPWSVAQPKHNFLMVAEESSKNAFQAIESVVNALVSVANMLNTTHNAVFNSFRAVAGVAQQFRTFRIYMFTAILVPVLRWCRFLWRHFLSFLRVRPRNYAKSEAIWTTIQQQEGVNGVTGHPNVASSLLFWLIALGGPLFIFKCVVRLAERVAADACKWTTGEAEHYTAQALFDFNAANGNELSFLAFDMLRIAPKVAQPDVKDWLLASTFDGTKVGLVPINYIKMIGKCAGNQTNSN
uniref:Peroxisomal membrane protein PEX13 n=1 Tax=Globodera rostochiensis TaxID=31243 RepID=A0A914I501_GLORO